MSPRFSDIHIVPKMGLVVSLFIIFQSVALALGTLFSYQVLGADTAKVQEGVLSNVTDWYGFMALQAITSFVGFGFTAIIFSYLEAGNFSNHLGLKSLPTLKVLGVAIIAIVAAQFFVELLVKINELIPAPESIVAMQEKIEKVIESATSFTTIHQFVIAVFVMAVVPAIAEEFFFRGLIMGDLIKAGMRPWSAIFVSGLIFSLVHFEFHNFLAIGVLGIFLGYLYYKSGSLWVCIAVHFINNFMAILMRYLFNLGIISKELSEAETPIWLSVIALLIFAGLAYVLERMKVPQSETSDEFELPNEKNTLVN